jgi:hypothetical protein
MYGLESTSSDHAEGTACSTNIGTLEVKYRILDRETQKREQCCTAAETSWLTERIGTCLLKTGIAEPEERSVARQ